MSKMWTCGSLSLSPEFWSCFLRKLDIFFQTSVKIINISLSTYSLMYVLKINLLFLEIFLKNIFPNFSQFSEFQWDNGDGDVGGDGENFLIGKCCENEMT